jgi:hypothetical protein
MIHLEPICICLHAKIAASLLINNYDISSFFWLLDTWFCLFICLLSTIYINLQFTLTFYKIHAICFSLLILNCGSSIIIVVVLPSHFQTLDSMEADL